MRGQVTSVRAFVELFLRSRDRLTSVGSPTGGQLEAMRNSVDGSMFIRDDGDMFRAVWSADDKHRLHALLSMIWSALDEETRHEQTIMELLHTPKGYFEIQCERKLSELRDGDGRTLIKLCYGEDGSPNGNGIVAEVQPLTWTAVDIAEYVKLSEPQVRRRITTGGRKILEHPLLSAIGGEG